MHYDLRMKADAPAGIGHENWKDMSQRILNVMMPDTDLPLALLVGYVAEPDVYELPAPEYYEDESGVVGEIKPEDVPVGDITEDRRERNRLIRQFYFHWLD